MVGQQRGVDTTKPEGAAPAAPVAPAAPKADNSANKAAIALLGKNGCTACHGVDKKIVGPGFNEIAKKHAGKADYLVGKIKAGGVGVWGPIPMPAQTINDDDAKVIAAWIAQGAAK
jgi:cytochrome c